MKLLLDTHIWIWALVDPKRLGAGVRAALTAPANELWLSPISVWEAIILAERGRIAIEGDDDPRAWVQKMVDAIPRREAPITHEIAIMSRTIELAHEDPADRFLAATARVHELTLVTADERLLKGEGFDAMANK